MAATNRLLALLALLTLFMHFASTLAFPSHAGSLSGLSGRKLDNMIAKIPEVLPPSPPGPPSFTGAKLVNDADHPWKPLREGDIRGPCPGLNTLASHGYLPRDGVATPTQIITAVQEGFNMDNGVARLAVYAALLVDGNPITDLLSIGGKTPRTGADPPAPATVGGLNTHAVFEGDASMTRGDFFFGDNHSFNQTLFDQFVEFSNKYGGGFYNLTVAAELRHHLIHQSIATNPHFDFTAPRFFTAYAESTFPYTFFVDGRITERGTAGLDMTNATLFFRDSKMPDDFWRIGAPSAGVGALEIYAKYPIEPGRNVGGVNKYTPDPNSGSFERVCLLYTNFVNETVKGLYPDPKGVLRRNLIINLGFLYEAFGAPEECPEQLPYGIL